MNWSWDSYFMNLVYLVASKSKDEKTHIGAVIVGNNNKIISTGYNSFPRSINDDVKERQERPEKYNWFAHAEVNAIYSAAEIGVKTEGCRMYTNGVPCSNCAMGIINSGIKEVIVDYFWDKHNYNQWKELAEITKQMFIEAEIQLIYHVTVLVPLIKYRDGKVI